MNTRAFDRRLLGSRRLARETALGFALLTTALVRDAGAGVNSWITTGPRLEGSVTVSSLVVAPSVPSSVYATANLGVLKTVDGGANWTFVNTNLPGTSLSSIGAIDPSAPDTLYGCGQGGPFKSTDGGRSWTAIKSGVVEPIVPSPTFCINAVDPSNPATLYASTSLKGLFKSIDGGMGWSAISTGLPTSLYDSSFPVIPGATVVIDKSAPTTLYAFNYKGVFRSDDAGGHWNAINAGLPTNITVTSLAVDPSHRGTLYVGETLGVFKTTNGGESWIPVSTGLGDRNGVRALVVDPSASATVYAATNNGVFKSTDGAESWAISLAGNAWTLAIDPVASGTIYVWMVFDDVFKSTDGGTTWVRTNIQRVEGACMAGPATLCLSGGRFRVEVNWRVPSQGTTGTGSAVSLTADTGYFWFFSDNNIELVIKVLDGRAYNGRFWVFLGALSNVEYTVTVTDTQTGTAKTYFNPSGTLASIADTAAF